MASWMVVWGEVIPSQEDNENLNQLYSTASHGPTQPTPKLVRQLVRFDNYVHELRRLC